MYLTEQEIHLILKLIDAIPMQGIESIKICNKLVDKLENELKIMPLEDGNK